MRATSVNDLLAALPEKRVIGTLPASVSSIAGDSRRVEPGACFVAVPGFKQDGRRFIPDAVRRGAAIVVSEGEPIADLAVAQVLVPSTRVSLARLAGAYYGHPSRQLTLVGITGTNGKTTTSYLIEALLRARGLATGVIGTMLKAANTTPESLDLMRLFAELESAGGSYATMEVSSHALELGRVYGLQFHTVVFTNLTRDHLDFHGTLESYRLAKRRLFELLAESPKPIRAAVVNGDDPSAEAMVRGLDLTVYTFGLGAFARVRAVEHTSSLAGIRMTVATDRGRVDLTSPLIGEHNVMNLLGAFATGLAIGLEPPAIARALATVGTVAGRFEQVRAGQPFLVVVDYAHTPDALERVLTTARKLTRERLGAVFGCGGDRDRGKRPIMGEIAARLCDRVWVTSDNPRSERPETIIDEIVAGVRRTGMAPDRYATEPDRAAAIRAALRWAEAFDTVVIAGKGHETYQIIGAEVLPFDDREVARRVLSESRT